MDYRIALAANVEGSTHQVFDILRTTEGQRAFWTTTVIWTHDRGRFGFLQAPVDLDVTVSLVEDELVSMTVTSGFPGWVGSTWQWSLSARPTTPRDHGPVPPLRLRGGPRRGRRRSTPRRRGP